MTATHDREFLYFRLNLAPFPPKRELSDLFLELTGSSCCKHTSFAQVQPRTLVSEIAIPSYNPCYTPNLSPCPTKSRGHMVRSGQMVLQEMDADRRDSSISLVEISFCSVQCWQTVNNYASGNYRLQRKLIHMHQFVSECHEGHFKAAISEKE